MAPKRSVPPPPPPPPVASSEETASGSDSDESEDEEEIAHSPPPVAPRNTAPPPQTGQESEGSDEEEDDDEEEGEEEDDEEDGKANQLALSSATTNPSSPPPNQEESEASDEEADEEVAPPKPAQNQEAEGKSAKPSSSIEGNKPSVRFQRTWSTDDEVRVLEALAAYVVEHGTLPQADALVAALAGRLDNSGCSASDLQKRVNTLKVRYAKAAKKGELPSKDQDRRLFDLSKSIWGSVTKAVVASSGARRDASEMCELYPYLAEEVKALEKVHRGLFKREFEMISDEKARALDAKIKKSRLAQMKHHQRRQDLIKEVTKTLIDLVD